MNNNFNRFRRVITLVKGLNCYGMITLRQRRCVNVRGKCVVCTFEINRFYRRTVYTDNNSVKTNVVLCCSFNVYNVFRIISSRGFSNGNFRTCFVNNNSAGINIRVVSRIVYVTGIVSKQEFYLVFTVINSVESNTVVVAILC